jgi:hypothetical protein
MSTTTKPALAKVTGKEDFTLPTPGVAFILNGRTYDLRTIDRATAVALANNPRCGFVQWAAGKGPGAKATTAKAEPAKA